MKVAHAGAGATFFLGIAMLSPVASADPPAIRHCKHDGVTAPAAPTWTGTSAMPRDAVEALRAAVDGVRGAAVPPGKTERYGHADLLVHAPLDVVLLQATAYGQYKDLNPWRFKTSRIVAKEKEQTDVYFQVSALKGLVTLWEVLRFGPPVQREPGVVRIEGTFVRGNVEDASILLDLHRIDDATTVISANLLTELEFPVPAEELERELSNSVGDAAKGMRDKSEAMVRARLEAAKPH